MSDWRPIASLEQLTARANLLSTIRTFFAKRDILEVETPLLAQTTVLDPNIESMQVTDGSQRYFLQTSPEFFMKRLIAAGSGSIFQISKAFRSNEISSEHNPEFTLLEWYRVGWDYKQLMAEVMDLIQAVLSTESAKEITYRQLYMEQLGIDPWHTTVTQCRAALPEPHEMNTANWTVEVWLDYLFTKVIEPTLGWQAPLFIYDYPERLAALAVCEEGEQTVAKRFELYVGGMELANGFQELTNAKEQRTRFLAEQAIRHHQEQVVSPIDERFLQALDHLPACSGVALGIDRLLMLQTSINHIHDVLAFPIHYV